MNFTPKKTSVTLFALIIFCFFLPFVTVSCQNQPIVTFSGLELATGKTIQQPTMFGESKPEHVPGEPIAALAFITACAGLATSLVVSRRKTIIPSFIGGFGTILLLFIKSSLDKSVLKESQNMLQTEYKIGFWLSLLLFLATALYNGYIYFQQRTNKLLK